MESIALNGPEIASAAGLKGRRRSNGSFVLESYDAELDVRLVVVIHEADRAVQLFIDRGKRHLPSYVGSIYLRDIVEVTANLRTKEVVFSSGEHGVLLTVWPNGRFKLV